MFHQHIHMLLFCLLQASLASKLLVVQG